MKAYRVQKDFERLEQEYLKDKAEKEDKRNQTDHATMQAIVAAQSDETLYDWACLLEESETVYDTVPPPWLLKVSGQKRIDLLDAIIQRIQHSDIPFIFNE